jgi:seryl-tRNA synthetase
MCNSDHGSSSLTEAYHSFTRELVAAGLLVPSGQKGVFGRSGVFEAVIAGFEAYVTRMGAPTHPEAMSFPPVLNRAHYLKTDHIHNFPNLMGSVHSFSGNDREQAEMIRKLEASPDSGDWTRDLSPTGVMLAPAACYPLYPASAGTLHPKGRTVELSSYVFRHEPSDDPARLQIFRMREFVRLGTPAQALAHRDHWLKKAREILVSLGLEVQVVVANDPFFGRGGKLRKATQREQDLKHEFVIPICSSENPTAIASCNYHLESFGAKFGIQSSDGQTAHSSCVGFGLERVALALFRTHGLETRAWPAAVRDLLRIEA